MKNSINNNRINNNKINEYRSVFYFLPNIKENTINKKNKHILVPNDFFNVNQIKNVSILKTIEEYKLYYYVFEDTTNINIVKLEDNMQYLLANKVIKEDDTILLKYPTDSILYLKTYLKALSSPRKYIFQIIEFYKHLLKSIDLLVTNKIVNNFISANSIIVSNNEIPLIKNFLFSIDVSNSDICNYIKQFFIEYKPSYIEWPPEFHLLAYLLTNKLTSLSLTNIEFIIHDIIENHYILKTFGPMFVSSYQKEATEYFQKYINQSYQYIISDILQFYTTWDNYALSIMYLRILIDIHRNFKANKKNKFIILFMKMLVCNIHLNPLKRLSIKETTNKFDYLLDNLQPNDYINLLASM